MTESIRGIHRMSDGTYGAPRVRAELAAEHRVRVGMKRVVRMVRAASLAGVSRRRYCVTTTRDDGSRARMDAWRGLRSGCNVGGVAPSARVRLARLESLLHQVPVPGARTPRR
ncbi:transposase [Myxococcus stipitatus]|uniref:transposase n=1 Tax=Myxococcus stipitatus TaxID=83455 RepID=UPI003B82ED8B